MADYIDRAELLKVLDRNSIYKKITYGDGRSIEKIIKSMPSVDAVEQKHGHWIVEDEDFNAYKCSNCNEVWCINDGTPEENEMNYCQHCGSKMDEVTE